MSPLYHHDASVIRLRPQYPNQNWSIDFVYDKLSNGLIVLDEHNREALRANVDSRMGSAEVMEALCPLLQNCQQSFGGSRISTV